MFNPLNILIKCNFVFYYYIFAIMLTLECYIAFLVLFISIESNISVSNRILLNNNRKVNLRGDWSIKNYVYTFRWSRSDCIYKCYMDVSFVSTLSIRFVLKFYWKTNSCYIYNLCDVRLCKVLAENRLFYVYLGI